MRWIAGVFISLLLVVVGVLLVLFIFTYVVTKLVQQSSLVFLTRSQSREGSTVLSFCSDTPVAAKHETLLDLTLKFG